MAGAPLNFLVVEDEAVLAMDITAVVEEAGHAVSGEASSLAEVAALPETLAVDCALVDIQLLHGSSGVDAACVLLQLYPSVRILFITANPRVVPLDFKGALGILEKPFSHTGLLAALGYVGRAIGGGDDPGPMPPGIRPVRQSAVH